MEQKPSIGRIVHVKNLDGSTQPNYQPVAPAMITSVHGEHCVNLKIIQDAPEDRWATSVLHESAVALDFKGLVWFWPPRVA